MNKSLVSLPQLHYAFSIFISFQQSLSAWWSLKHSWNTSLYCKSEFDWPSKQLVWSAQIRLFSAALCELSNGGTTAALYQAKGSVTYFCVACGGLTRPRLTDLCQASLWGSYKRWVDAKYPHKRARRFWTRLKPLYHLYHAWPKTKYPGPPHFFGDVSGAAPLPSNQEQWVPGKAHCLCKRAVFSLCWEKRWQGALRE